MQKVQKVNIQQYNKNKIYLQFVAGCFTLVATFRNA